MSVIVRLLAILFGLLIASLIAGAIIVIAMLFPDLTDFSPETIDLAGINLVISIGFIFFSGFALMPALVIVLVTEALSIRSLLAYALGGAVVGVACYLGLVPFDPDTMRFNGIVHRHLEIMTGAGIVAGVVYWMIAGRNAGRWGPKRPPSPPPQRLPS